KACPRTFCPPRFTNGSARAATENSPTSYCRPCVTNSAATSKSRPAENGAKMQQAKPKELTGSQLDELAINTIRTLSIDAVQKANSGHPGTPMALAPLVYVIWNQIMNFDPKDPIC